MVGRVAGLDHQGRKTSAPTTVTPTARIDEPDRRRSEGGERDPRRDAAAERRRPRSGLASRSSCPGGAIADAADCRDVARRFGVVAELVAQPADVDVDRPVQDVGLSSAVDRVEQLVAGQDAAVGLEDRLEEPELDPGQRDRLAVAGDLVAVEVDDEVGVEQRRTGRRRSRAGSVRRRGARIDLTRRTSSAGENGFGR